MSKIIVFIAALCLFLAGCTSEIPAEISENTADGAQISAEDSAESDNVSCEIVYNDLVLWKDTIDTTWGCGFVGVKNTGSTNLFMESGRFDIENADGTLATTEDYINVYPQVIAPGETAWYYMCTTVDGLSVGGEYTIVPKVNAKLATVDLIRYGVSEVNVTDTQYLGIEVTARIENTSAEDVSMPKVAAILFSSNGNPLACMMTYGDELDPGEKQGVKATALAYPPDISAADVASYEIYAYPEQFQFDW